MKLRHLLIGMLALVAAVSCKEDQPVEAPTLEVSETSLSFAAEGGEKSFNLTANLDWTATPDADWLSVEPTSGKGSDKATAIKVTADENTTAEARTATVKVKAGALSETISVTQAKKEATEPEQPEQPEQPETPEPVVLAEWIFSADAMKEYADSFGGTTGVKDNTAGDGGKRLAANVSGTGYISYVQIDKTAMDPENSVQRTVGKSGHPYATGGWVGDYWLFTFGDKAIAKSSKVSIKYITRSSKTGMKYWRLEYLDGTEWKPAMATKTVKLTDGTEVACNIEMYPDGSKNVEVDVVVEYANDTAEPCFRMLSLSVEKAEGTGPLEAINTGTSRIAGAAGTSPVIKLVSAPTK